MHRALKRGVLCNNASIDFEDEEEVGDPLETALLAAGEKAGILREELLEKKPEIREVAFDSEVKMMATFHELKSTDETGRKGDTPAVGTDTVVSTDNTDGEEGRAGVFEAVKGAPDEVLQVCSRAALGKPSVHITLHLENLRYNGKVATGRVIIHGKRPHTKTP